MDTKTAAFLEVQFSKYFQWLWLSGSNYFKGNKGTFMKCFILLGPNQRKDFILKGQDHI